MSSVRRIAIRAVVAVMLAGLMTGCQKEGAAEKAGKEVDKAVEKVGQQMEKAGDSIKDAVKRDNK